MKKTNVSIEVTLPPEIVNFLNRETKFRGIRRSKVIEDILLKYIMDPLK